MYIKYVAKGNISFQGKDYELGDEVPEEIALKIITCVKKIEESSVHLEVKEAPIMTTKDLKKKTIKKP